MADNRDNRFEPYLRERPRSHPVLAPQVPVNVTDSSRRRARRS